MSHACEHHTPATGSILNPARYRRVLWLALWINAAMFGVELFSGWHSGSLSLLADSIDFAGDALNYGVSLAVLSAALAWRARAAVLKALCMMGFGVLILGRAVWCLYTGTVPDATTMGAVGLLALVANVAVAWMLYAFREGDANMRSVWLCSRNDAIGNLLVMLAAAGVLGTGRAWPDVLVAAGMAALALQGGWQVMRQARLELATPGATAASRCDTQHHGHSH
nr:cation transporter [uncultured Rhodoferax sp.]